MLPEFELLVEKYLRDELAPAELKLFLNEARDPGKLLILRRIITEKIQQKVYSGLSEKGITDMMFRQMLDRAANYTSQDYVDEPLLTESRISSLKKTNWKTISLRKLAAIAAAFFLLFGVGMLWLHRTAQHQRLAVHKPAAPLKNDVEPGGNKAMLTLSDGSTINLADAGNGVLARQGNTKVVQLSNGQITYQVSDAADDEVYYNTLRTPRGGQYQITLPDGTQVWLNASSSITYPTAFNNRERKVTMTGEVYFEVTPHASLPFRVITRDMQVDVCGTHFNVCAYMDETSTSTTLLEGAVNVTAGDHAPMSVKPGQRAVWGAGNMKLIENADVEETIAWKEGLFSFNGADLPSIMRQLARWYDLDIRYEGPPSKRHFTGKVFRNLNLSEILKVLELNQIQFRLEGNRLTVTS